MPHESVIMAGPTLEGAGGPMRESHADPVSGELWSMAEELGEIGSFDRDLRNGTARVSDTMCRIFGLDRAALESSENAWMNRIHPDDRGEVENALRAATADGATNIKFQYRIVREGQVRWISTRLRIDYDAQGVPSRRFGVNQDMTDRYSTTIANAHLAAVVDSSSEAIKSYALDGTILSSSAAKKPSAS